MYMYMYYTLYMYHSIQSIFVSLTNWTFLTVLRGCDFMFQMESQRLLEDNSAAVYLKRVSGPATCVLSSVGCSYQGITTETADIENYSLGIFVLCYTISIHDLRCNVQMLPSPSPPYVVHCTCMGLP